MSNEEEVDGWKIHDDGLAERGEISAEILRMPGDVDLVEFCCDLVCVHIPLAVVKRLIEIDEERNVPHEEKRK